MTPLLTNPDGKIPKANKQRFVPKPVLHLAGDNDPLVKFDWQAQMINAVRKLNQCGEGKPWVDEKGCTIYQSKAGAPVVTFIHSGQHGFPQVAPELIVKFFRQSGALK